jgi:hypothetical protein
MIASTNQRINRAAGNMENDILDDILDIYCSDDSTYININIDWYDEYESFVAVLWDGLNLQYVPVQTDELCLAAVQENGLALQYVLNKTSEICSEAVKNDGLALQFVEDQTEDMCYTALMHKPLAFKYVKNKTPGITEYAINEEPFNIKFANNITPKMCKELIDNDPLAIFMFNNPPPELCLYALKKDLRCIGSVDFSQVPTGVVRDALMEFLLLAKLKYGDELQPFGSRDDLLCYGLYSHNYSSTP